LALAEALVRGDRLASDITNALTVDVEEYFTVQNLDAVVPWETWPAHPLRADRQIRQLLDLFEARGAKATFFVLGWVAERMPALLKEIHRRGHEVAAHSYWHRLVFEQGPEEFRSDLKRVKALLEDTIGAPVHGYRAPTYSVTKHSLWAHPILVEEGFRYSSSIFPITHDRYGIPDYPRFPMVVETPAGPLWEFPLTTLRTFGKNLPVAGGGYLRLLPARSVAAGLAWVNRRERQPAIVYLHPWEIDPEIPRFRQGWLKDTRGYLGLSAMLGKLDYLLSVLSFDRVDRVLSRCAAAAPSAPSPGSTPP
jgi:polysaccharide deacetylase family protein (PEP-CTERM system associated)